MFISKKDREYIEGEIRDINIEMWRNTLWEKRIDAQIEKLEQEIKNLQSKILSTPDLVECETCECAIKKETATKGESIIKKYELPYFIRMRTLKNISTPHITAEDVHPKIKNPKIKGGKMEKDQIAKEALKVRDFLDKTELSNEEKIIILRVAAEVTERIGKMGEEIAEIISKNSSDEEDK